MPTIKKISIKSWDTYGNLEPEDKIDLFAHLDRIDPKIKERFLELEKSTEYVDWDWDDVQVLYALDDEKIIKPPFCIKIGEGYVELQEKVEIKVELKSSIFDEIENFNSSDDIE